ncbi:tRNA lysidine(34) synthetase TilS [Phenylobacterium sp.]|uniref:tRNA lysidine(34) synthetase TilS n=1 Tax=Phenylobacterium sp. TaxID=1871053 RepID=UPI00273163B0|nr:tRNA lysidine(34) synthetase TilS [Phenylobacterium sp.]MDP1874336.1 tRNA lysidine(34) synthetase TilS [Phenylobacterium sp.]
MRLSSAPEPWGPVPNALFDAHLSPASAAPLAVAYSGGGDSLALLLAAHTWSRARGRRLVVLHVDHGLQTAAGVWAAHCQATAERLGLPFQSLTWTGPKPATGLPAAARAARHRLLADAARAIGAPVVLLGHTADDVLETRQMRRDGATTPDPRPWAPSPAWPEGRGVFLLRPLLATRRSELRARLEGQPLTWIEDPANADLAYARARARARLAGERDASPEAPGADHEVKALAQAARHAPGGAINWDRSILRAAPGPARARLLSIACLCAAGGARPPRREAVERIAAQVAGASDSTATLAGARIEITGAEVWVMREAGEARRGGLTEVLLAADQPTVWDGRFEVRATGPGLRAGPLAGRLSQLETQERRRLAPLPAGVRRAWPALIDSQDQVRLTVDGVTVESLVQSRFDAAAGLVTREPDPNPA